MPKEYDAKRNYYADLELPITASVDDVKKQYRKLALQYHPDRNPGKESEYIPRFQAIQTAHEILGDPAKKILYDADRRKQVNVQTGGPVPRGHPYRAASNFPPPPRRTQPGEWKRPPTSQPRGPQDGANRFSGFAGAPPPTPPPRADPTQEHYNMFKAWDNMKAAQDRQHARKKAGNAGTPDTQGFRRPQPPPRNDTEYPRSDQARPTASDTDSADGRRSAWEAFNQSKSPQPGVRRNHTTRTPRKQGFDPSAPGSDERPASGSYYNQRHRSEDFGRPQASTSPDTTSKSARRPNIDPTRPNRDANDDAPFLEGNRKRTPYSSFIGEKTAFKSPLRRSKSSRDTTPKQDPTTSARPRSSSPPVQGRHAGETSFDFPSTDSEAGTSGSADSSSAEDIAFARKPNFHRPPSERPKKVPSPPSRRFDRREGGERPDYHERRGASPSDNIFTFNGAAPFSPPPMPSGKSRSEENINLKFANQWNGTFEGSSNVNATQPRSRKSTYQKQNYGKNRPNFGQASPLGAATFGDTLPPPPPGPAPKQNLATSPPHSTSFQAQQGEAFKNFGWSVPPPPARTVSSEQMQNASRPPYNASTRDRRRSSNGVLPSPSVEEDEMDIDEPPPPKQFVSPTSDAGAMPPPPKPIRMVSVPPSAWHQEQAGKPHHIRAASSNQAQTADRASGLKTNLDDLFHVDPIARPPDAGLKNLSDVLMNLPYQSQASNVLPFQQTDGPQALPMPPVPVPPSAPERLTKLSWQEYATKFSTYLQHFHTFNAQVLRHLAAREALAEQKMAQGMGWLEANGDVSGGRSADGITGFAAYARDAQEDVRIRETWSVGCDRHLQAVKVFDATRERVRRLVSGGGLVEK